MSASVPLVGLTTYTAQAAWGPFDQPSAVIGSSYYELVASAGARPLLLPSVTELEGGPAAGSSEIIEVLDALVLIGGLDVDPARYGAEPDVNLGRIDAARDESEIGLLEAALRADIPILAICRGHQLLNVALGGTLVQHVPDRLGSDHHQPAPGAFTHHKVACVEGTRTASIFGQTPMVACSHHQVIDELASDLVVTAWSIELEGRQPVIEAVERPASRFCVGVQWHPEETADVRPFAAMLDAIE